MYKYVLRIQITETHPFSIRIFHPYLILRMLNGRPSVFLIRNFKNRINLFFMENLITFVEIGRHHLEEQTFLMLHIKFQSLVSFYLKMV